MKQREKITQKPTIFLASPHHISLVMGLINAVIKDMAAQQLDQWDEYYPTSSILEQDIKDHTLYLCTRQNELCGLLVLNEHQDEEYQTIPWRYNAGQVLVVHRLCVHPNRRGKGYASRLMDFAEQYARDNKYTAIRLDANTANSAAINLYEKRNYEKIGQVFFRDRAFPFNCYEKLL